MKFTAFLLVAACLQASAKGYSQEVTLSLKNVSLEQVFNQVKKQTGLSFIWDEKMLQQTHPVSIDMKNAKVSDVLDHCLENQPLTYQVIGKIVVIKQKSVVAKPGSNSINDLPPPVDVHGKVVNEKGEPVIATVMVKGTKKAVSTNDNGEFTITGVGSNATLIITGIGIEAFEVKVNNRVDLATLSAKTKVAEGAAVIVTVNTGYQTMPGGNITGSFVQVNNDLLNRKVTTDILTRLDGITSGVYFNGAGSLLGPSYGLPNVIPSSVNKLGITIRGQSTLSGLVSKDPLIVVDNFPYEGDINNIDPEIVESITILKDAASASIWGARAGNGVIVITTRKGRRNQKPNVNFNANVTIAGKPDVFKSKLFLNSPDFINVEDTLFLKGYFNSVLNSNAKPVISDAVEIFAKLRAGQISQADAEAQVNVLRGQDIRNDYEKYIYQKSVTQQYGLTLTGGTDNLAYSLSTAYSNIKPNLVRNGYDRIVINSVNTYTPVKNLEITAALTYTQLNMQSDNALFFKGNGLSTGGIYSGTILPYAKLADDQGNHLSVVKDYRTAFVDSVYRLGFLDWHYRPLDELALADNTTKQSDLILKAGVKYKFASFLNGELLYQNERQGSLNTVVTSAESYIARNLINKYTQYTPATGSFSYPLPTGGILRLSPSDLVSNNYRGQLNYNQTIKGRHAINGIVGAEIRDTRTKSYARTTYGYDSQTGVSTANLNYNTSYKINPGGSTLLPAPDGNYLITTNRFISFYSSLGYTYNDKYTITLSGRRDGANIFGVKTNDKFTPLWSSGLRWNVSKEKFYQFKYLPYLNLRASYGYNGNVYNAAAYLIARYLTSSITGAQSGNIISPPNPSLRWERVRNINIGLDFIGYKNIINGSIELYQKEGLDLIQLNPLAPSTGFLSFNGNAASTRTKGMDLTLNTNNIDQKFKWQTTLVASFVHDKVISYDVAQTATSIQTSYVALKGKPLFGVYSYKWAGLNPANGNPRGYLNGKISEDYVSIINNFSPDSLVFNGSAIPVIFGSVRNTFTYKQFSLSFNITYKFRYVFRKPSTSLNYADIIINPIYDYPNRWQKPGDEVITNVPSLVYPANTYRNQFYQFSEALIEKGGLIRLQDISFSYDISEKEVKKLPVKNIRLYFYLNNIGLLWRANKDGIDPDFVSGWPNSRSISIGVKTEL